MDADRTRAMAVEAETEDDEARIADAPRTALPLPDRDEDAARLALAGRTAPARAETVAVAASDAVRSAKRRATAASVATTESVATGPRVTEREAVRLELAARMMERKRTPPPTVSDEPAPASDADAARTAPREAAMNDAAASAAVR